MYYPHVRSLLTLIANIFATIVAIVIVPITRRPRHFRLAGAIVLGVAAVIGVMAAGGGSAIPTAFADPPDTINEISGTAPSLGVQSFLEQHPGPLKTYHEDGPDGPDGQQGQSAAGIIEGYSLYYGVSPYLHLALLETVNGLLSTAAPPDEALRFPYGPAGPEGFAAQIEWASREIRAGFGPYEQPPTVHFTDGVTMTLTLDQAPEGVAIQRFLANGHTADEWFELNKRFTRVFQDYFNNELPALEPLSPSGRPLEAPTSGFLQCPWPIGVRVVHLAYFDHTYPTVDSGGDGNNVVMTYVGPAAVQYNTHDGHDYFFPDLPIGTPILASAPGIAYARTARGNGVVILHGGGYETVYWHLNSFAPKMRSIVDAPKGVWVEAGEVLGTSGTSGFTYGSPHLHFEVRHHGRQVDPYGWYGGGDDPCGSYAGCEPSTWLWHSDLYGIYDFTPPDHDPDDFSPDPPTPDLTPPIGTFSINPPEDLLFLAHFDGHTLQEVGTGEPQEEGAVTFDVGQYGRAVHLPMESGLSYPTADNLHLPEGTISLWAKIPESYPYSPVNRHYLLSTSANPEDGGNGYPGTLAIRRDVLSADGLPQWTFWTTPNEHEMSHGLPEDTLSAKDTLEPGWHHIVVTWDAGAGRKKLYLDGAQVAATDGVTMPVAVGERFELGRFSEQTAQSGVMIDELAIFGRALDEGEVVEMVESPLPLNTSATVVNTTSLTLDTNALDRDSVIVAMQMGNNGMFSDPQPFYDHVTWELPPKEGEHTITVRYFDRASNQRSITRTVLLALPPRGQAHIAAYDRIGATLAITATDNHQPIEMQISQSEDFAGAVWEPLRPAPRWLWVAGGGDGADGSLDGLDGPSLGATSLPPRPLFIRFRGGDGNVSAPQPIVATETRLYLPYIVQSTYSR